MALVLRRILIVLVALVFQSSMIGAAFAGDGFCDMPAHATASGLHQHHHTHPHHQGKAAGTACCDLCPCCLSAAAATGEPVVAGPAQQVTYLLYAAAASPLTGRSVAPDPSPPRPIA